MFFIEINDPTLADKIQKGGKEGVDFLSKVVWPALAALVPALGTALFKVFQDHSRARRSVQLTERISSLAKSLAELPELSPPANPSAVTPRAALTTELNLAVSELAAIQSRVHHSFRDLSSTATARMRSALLLYRPNGFLAFTLHALFYIYSLSFAFGLLAFLIGIADPTSGDPNVLGNVDHPSFVSDLLGFIMLVGIFSIPSLVLHHYAARIHRKQCLETQNQDALKHDAQNAGYPAGTAAAISQQQL